MELSVRYDLALLTVTYNPELQLLEAQLDSVPEDALVVVIDNCSEAQARLGIRGLIAHRPYAYLVENESNIGLAAALNQAALYVKNCFPCVRYILLMDQDSIPSKGAISTMMDAYLRISKNDPKVACIGPRLIDRATGLQHGFHQIKGIVWKRNYPDKGELQPIRCVNLNGSGTFVALDLFLANGGLDSSLFIDHVDTEWAFRMISRGYSLYGLPFVEFGHSMGANSLRFWWFGWRVWPCRSPNRHYFLFRNAVWLMRRSYVPMVWKVFAVIKLMMTLSVHFAFDPSRRYQVGQMIRGVRDGVFRRGIIVDKPL